MLLQDYYLINPNTPLALAIALIGLGIWLASYYLSSPVHSYLLANGLEALPGSEDFSFRESRFSKWCLTKYHQGIRIYNLTVNILKVTGYWTIALASHIQTLLIWPGFTLVAVFFAALFTYFALIRWPTIEAGVRYILEDYAQEPYERVE